MIPNPQKADESIIKELSKGPARIRV